MKLARYQRTSYIYRYYNNGGGKVMNRAAKPGVKLMKIGVLAGAGYLGLKVIGWTFGIVWSLFSFALSLGFWAGLGYLAYRGWQWLKSR